MDNHTGPGAEEDDRPRGPRTTRRVHAFPDYRGHLTQFFLDEGLTFAPESLPLFMEAMEEEFFAAHHRLMNLAKGDRSKDGRPERLPAWEPSAASTDTKTRASSGESSHIVAGGEHLAVLGADYNKPQQHVAMEYRL